MKKTINIEKILQLFVREGENRHEWMGRIFTLPGRTAATDGAGIAWVDEELGFDLTDDVAKVENVIASAVETPNSVLLHQLQTLANSLPKVDEGEWMSEDCPECNGDGKVDYEYEDLNGRVHDLEGDCPRCDGTGKCDNDVREGNVTLDIVREEIEKEIEANFAGSIHKGVSGNIAGLRIALAIIDRHLSPATDTQRKPSRCCGRCDGVNDVCVTDMVCDSHGITGCVTCWPHPATNHSPKQ